MRPSRLIDAAGRERIEAAVREAEAGTSGEIVVAVDRSSAPHPVAPWRCAVLLAAVALLLAANFLESMDLVAVFASQALAVALAHALCRIDAIRRLFLSEAELESSAREGAHRSFAQHGIRRTRGGTGILIYVALLEHRVVVLGDEAIDRALGPEESWADVVALVLEGIRAGQATDGIVRAVRRCGEILTHPLPVRVDDRDEIARGLILSD